MSYDPLNESSPVTATAPSLRLAPGSTRMPAPVLASLTDRDRICPYPAGICLVDGGRVVMRMPEGELALQVPARLLRQAFRLCDGTTTWNEVLAKVPARSREEFARFMEFLWAEGALIDAIQLARHAASLAFIGAGLGLRAEPSLTRQIGQRFVGDVADAANDRPADEPSPPAVHTIGDTPLDEHFATRESVRTFGSRPVSARQLHALLWSTGGVVARRPAGVPRRTLGSGGAMHLVRWVLVLPQAMAGHPAGVYEAEFPGERRLRLRPLAGDLSQYHRAFERPWQQSFAAGAIFAVASAEVGALRYRNRAVQYLFLEAGAGLQNLALAAPGLGLACSVIGGYTESVVRRLCGLGDELILCSAIFGSPPSASQLAMQSRMLEVDFEWAQPDASVYPLNRFVGRAKVDLPGGGEVVCWGSDLDARLAYTKAHAESIERQGMQEPRNIVVGRLADLPGAIAPEQVAAYLPEQYRSSSFPYAPFMADETCQWVRGSDLGSGRPVHVVASFVFRWEKLQALPGAGARHTQANSSGCGAGPTRDFALKAALLEVIERDAFMRCWLSQTPGRAVAPAALPRETQERVANLRDAGCEVVVQLLPSVAGHVALVSVRHEARHFTCVTGACRQDAAQAVEAALNELELMVYVRMTGLVVPPMKLSEVKVPGDHAGLYCQARHFRKADAVLRPVASLSRLPRARETQDLQGLIDSLAAKGLRPAFVDMTPACNALDQGRTPLVVVKAIVPSLVPISFGFGREPRGMVGRVDPGSRFPHPFP